MREVADSSTPMPMRGHRGDLERLLQDLLENPERREAITDQIHALFGQQKAVMVLDMSGFSRTTQSHGIVSFLLMIHQMHLLTRPCIEQYGGTVVKEEADNLYCLFDTVEDALSTSLEIKRSLTAANRLLPEERRLYVSIGIGYGEILYIGDEDLFGNEVNLASKLGEDVAEMGEILLTAAARASLGDSKFVLREQSLSISGITVGYFKVKEK